jgi:hypothetical protein
MCFDCTGVVEGVVAFAAAPFVLAPIIYVTGETASRPRWWDVPDGGHVSARVAGPYRGDGGELPTYHRRAPAAVRWAAFTSIFVGLWAIPLIPIAALLTFVGGLGLILLIPIGVGFGLVGAGRGLLQRRLGCVPRAARFAQLAMTLAGLYLLLAVVIAALGAPDNAPFVLIMFAQGAGVLLQSRFLARTARIHTSALEHAT